jgi:hypothetical protein
MKVTEILTESVSLEQLTEEFDLIESIINRLAAHNGVDAEVIWEDLETLTEDELYAFAVTSEPIMESQDVAEGFGGGAAGFLMGIPLAAMTTIVGLLFGTSETGANVFLGTMALSTALGSWLQNKSAEADNKINSYRSKKIFSVFVNGEKISTNLMDYANAGKMIANLAKKEHDPNTYFTIYDNEAEEISWRFQIKDDKRENDEVEESIDQGVAEGSDEIRTAGRGAIRIPGDMSAPHWREPTWSFQEIAQKLGIPVSALNLLAFNRIGGFPEALPGLAARYGSKKYYKQSEIKRWVNANNVREKLKQGMLEGALDDSNFGKSAASMTPTPQAAQQARDIVQQRADDNVISQAKIAGAVPITREGEQQKGADYRDPKEVDYDGEYDAMVARVKRLAGLGPMKTVYDPKRRVYRNMPTAQQPKK